MLPDGWLPIPFAVAPSIAEEMAGELLQASGAVAQPDADIAAARKALARALTRLPITTSTAARLWHGFGESATEAIADLSLADWPADTLESHDGADFEVWERQRTQHLDGGGRATLAVVSPDGETTTAFLLRVQVPRAGEIRVVDVLDRDLAVIGLVWDDIVALATSAA